MKIIAVLALALLTVSCANGTKSIEITGESIVTLGKTFNATGTAITNGCIAKTYTVKTCDDFRAFEKKFKALYPGAKDLWNTASQFGDKTAAQNVAAILANLSAELAPFVSVIGGK